MLKFIPKYFFRLVILLCLFSHVSDAQTVTANFTANFTSGCSPLAVTFTNTSVGATSYTWDFGNGQPQINTTSSGPQSTTYSGAQIYTVTLTAFNGSQQSVKTLTITIYANPTVNFSASPTTVCLGYPITFTSNSTLNGPGPGTYQWNFGNGQSATGTPITYTYTSSGTYNVTLTVTSAAGCVGSLVLSSYVTILAPPLPSFSASPTVTCTNSTVTFTNTTPNASTLNSTWSFGDNSPNSNATNPTHQYANPGTYTVTLKEADGNGCKDSTTYTNYITVIPGTNASFTGPSALCAGQTATFTNTSTPGFTACNWDFGDGGSGVGSPISHTYNVPGTYNVTLNSTNNNCSDAVTHTIVVSPLPNVNISYSPQWPCPAPTTVAFSSTTPGSHYKWNFGDGDTSNLQNPNHLYNHDDTFTIKLIVTTAAGCVDSALDTVYVLPLLLHAGDSSLNGCLPVTACFFDSAGFYWFPPVGPPPFVSYPEPTVAWHWHFGDGDSSTAEFPCHTYTAWGDYNVTLTITTANGCTTTDSFTILAGNHDTARFYALDTVICIHGFVTFVNHSSGATNYDWDFGDGTGAQYAPPDSLTTHQYNHTGIFTVTLDAVNNGCGDTMKKTLYITVHPPESIFFMHYNCAIYNQVQFIDSGIRATSFKWDFGDGTYDSVNKNPIHNYAAIGNYTVTFYTYNDTFGCRDTTTRQLTISQPVVIISTPDTAVCKNSPITLTGSLTGPYVPPAGYFSFNWHLDNTSYIDTTSIRTHTFTTIGQKPVRLIITDYRGCFDTGYRTLLVAWPTVNFSAAPTSICALSSVSFTDLSTDAVTTSFVSHIWDFGDNTSLTGNNANPIHQYNSPGLFNVTLTVTDNVGCTDTNTKQAYISVHKPEADFSTPILNICQNTTIQFYNLSQGDSLTYRWHFGDNTGSQAYQPTHTYSTPGSYTVSLVVTDNIGCKDSFVIPNYITVETSPVASFSLTDTFSICKPVTDTFTNTSIGGSSYYWTFGDGNTSTLQNAVNSFASAGLYTVTMVVSNSFGCKDTATAIVNILGYSGLITYNPLKGCAPLTVEYIAHISNIPSLVYDFSDGTTLATNSDTVYHTYTTPGAYIPRLLMFGAPGCSSSSFGDSLIRVDGVYAGFSYMPFPACGNDSVHFTDTSHGAFSTIASREWIFHDGITSSSINPTHYYGPGTYNVTLIDTTTSGCTDSLHSSLTVFNIPIISAGPDTTICIGDAATLKGQGGVSYTWSPTATLSCSSCDSTYATPTTQTQYYVTGTDANGCTNTDSVIVSLKTKAGGVADSMGQLCQLDTLQLNAKADAIGATYNWIPATGLSNSHIANPTASPNGSTKYMLIISEGKCIPDTLYDNIIVFPIPLINVSPSQTIIAGSSYTILTTEQNVANYLWTPDSYLDCDTCGEPTTTPPHSILYTVHVTSVHGCVDSAKIQIDVICDHSQVFIPNTFTPNNDGANDVFYPHGKGLKIINSFRIYDRWGEMIYERENFNLNDRTGAWDGTYSGKKLTPDIYVYVVNAICETGTPITWTGDVALIR